MQRLISRLSCHDWLIVAVVSTLVILHFLALKITPPGFFIDEALTGAHVTSMLDHGTDANGTAWPLFSSSVGGGYTTSVYLYPLVAWSSIFGTHEYALRAFSTFITILAILILGLGVRIWTRNKKSMYTTWIVGLILPWAWLGGSVAWDPAMLPLFVALAWLGFGGLLHHKRHRTVWLLLLGISLLLGAYVYPPFRVSGPLLLLGATIYAYHRHRVTVKHLAVATVTLGLLAIPLLKFLLQPGAMSRSQSLSVFAGGIIDGLLQTIYNYLLLLNPVTLFVTGDPNLRHSTGLFGMLGGVGLVGAIGLVAMWCRPRHQVNTTLRTPLLVASAGAVIALLGSALTNEGQPHYLRATAAWPFFVILITIGWQRILLARRQYIYAALCLCGVITAAYITDLTTNYPARSANAFDSDIRRNIKSGTPVPYPDSAVQYYRQLKQ